MKAETLKKLIEKEPYIDHVNFRRRILELVDLYIDEMSKDVEYWVNGADVLTQFNRAKKGTND